MHNLGFDAYDKAIKNGITNKNSPLTEQGEEQSNYTTEYLQRVFDRFDRMFASDFLRTHAIPRQLGGPFITDSRLGER
jgi:broad specificity phosphatase PhoE